MLTAIDAHCHLDHAFGGGWIDRPAAELLAELDAAGIERLVDLSGGWGVTIFDRHLHHLAAAAPDRFAVLGGIDLASWPAWGDRFGSTAAASLEAQLDRGAAGLKVWKTLGLEATDQHGERVSIDDPRLDPVWRVCHDRGAPVVIHVGDPPEFFRPLGPDNPRTQELLANPTWHWYERAEVSQVQLIEEFEGLLTRWPDVAFVGAHLLDTADRPRELRRLLTSHPNLSVDLGARFPALEPLPTDLVACLCEHPRQVLYGLDHPPDAEHYRRTIDLVAASVERGLAILDRRGQRDDVLESILRGNALRTFFS